MNYKFSDIAILFLGHQADLIVATEQWGRLGGSDVGMKKYLRGPHVVICLGPRNT